MALSDFQRALSELVASPQMCRLVIEDSQGLLERLELTELELRRLQHCAQHRGIKVCWSLHRANRLGPINAVLPLTCVALGPHLRSELEAFWDIALPRDLQFKNEGERFAAFLLQRSHDGAFILPVLEDLVLFELAVAELRFQPRRTILDSLENAKTNGDGATLALHPLLRLVRFRYAPEPLLEALTQDRPPPANLTQGEFYVLVDATEEGLAVRLLEPHLGRLLESFKPDRQTESAGADVNALLHSGMIVRWPCDAETIPPLNR